MAIQGMVEVQVTKFDVPNDDAGKVKKASSFADEMKDIRKQRLRRQVFEDAKLAGKLVAVEASPVYNAKGQLIQTLGNSL